MPAVRTKKWIKFAKQNAQDKNLGETVRAWYKEELRKMGINI